MAILSNVSVFGCKIGILAEEGPEDLICNNVQVHGSISGMAVVPQRSIQIIELRVPDDLVRRLLSESQLRKPTTRREILSVFETTGFVKFLESQNFDPEAFLEPIPDDWDGFIRLRVT